MYYIKKIPIALSLGMGLIMGISYLYQRRTLTEIGINLVLIIFVFYFLGTIFKTVSTNLYDQYQIKKKYEEKLAKQEGNKEDLENNNKDRTDTSSIDLVAGNNDDDFQELGSYAKKK